MGDVRHRYLAGLPRGEQRVLLSWRLLSGDAPDTPFHIERKEGDGWKRITRAPIEDSTCFLDHAPAPKTFAYRVVTPSGTCSESIRVDAGAQATLTALEVPLDPEDTPESLVLGDLQNDGRMGYVVRSRRAGTIWLTAFGHEGSLLWKFDTRLPCRGGWDGSMHHVPYLCWDVNNDGRTEVVFRSYPGKYPKPEHDTAIPGETLMVVDGETGQISWQAPWPAVKYARVMMTLGYLNGQDREPSIVIQDGTYARPDVRLTAVNGKTGEKAWQRTQERAGGHNLDIADIDEDGVQEVICGGICYNGDGSIRWEAEPFGHTDISKPARIDPNGDGLQIWYAVENPKEHTGVYLVDKDGHTLFKERFRHAHYGWIARHAPGVPGLHPHTAEDGRTGYGASVDGGHFPIFLPGGSHWLNLTNWQRKNFVPVHWDEGAEVVFIIRKENKRVVRLLGTGDILDLADSKLPESAEFGRNLACMDVLGDFRENIVTIDRQRHSVVVLHNPTPAKRRGYSPNDDFEYRHDRSQIGSGYYIYLSPPDTRV